MNKMVVHGELLERIRRHSDTCVSVRPGASRVFVGMDIRGRYAAQEVLITTEDARHLAQSLLEVADAVDKEIAREAAEEAQIRAATK